MNLFEGDRRVRRPSHNFAVESYPWEITTVGLAPVLPGETLQHIVLQSRAVTPPIKSRVVGWWLEYYFFYVTFRQMGDAANLVAMFVDPTATLSNQAAAAENYYNGIGYSYGYQASRVVIQEWFRREGETLSASIGRSATRYSASHGMDRLDDSLIDNTVLPDGGAAGTNADDVSRNIMVTEYRRMLRELGGGGGQVDYEEVLASYGASLRENKKRDRPELLRYVRQWQYPTNTVEPSTGVPTTAVSWAVSDRADKKRFFTEPGLIIAMQCVRPKIYFANQTGNGMVMLDRAQRWLPPAMEDLGYEKSLAEFATNQGPFGKAAGGFTNGYWLDVRDLYNYGDQYLDVVTPANFNSVALPTVGEITRYPTKAMADGLLVTADTLIYCDGNIQFQIKTRAVDKS